MDIHTKFHCLPVVVKMTKWLMAPQTDGVMTQKLTENLPGLNPDSGAEVHAVYNVDYCIQKPNHHLILCDIVQFHYSPSGIDNMSHDLEIARL